MKRLILILTITLGCLTTISSKEGMWLPVLLERNIGDMQAMGLKLSAEDIYSINKNSLKDAIVMFGQGCTGEIVSDEGLIMTNHHCGYGSIQKLSSIANDYLTDGFWADNKEGELICDGLSVTILVNMQDITKNIEEIDANPDSKEWKEAVKAIEEEAIKGTHYKAEVEKYFYGNQYFLLTYEKFDDIRLVGTPPSSIGKFGNDTDNWVWPRHTGDFSVFRIYADKDNNPAAYSPENVPYKPKQHLKVSLDGYKEGDFTFVFGYPGRTQEYLPSQAIDMIVNVSNPIRINLRGQKLDIMNREQAKDKKVWIDYAAKNAGLANGWKKWIGESGGIKRYNGIAKKQAFEQEFQEWIKANPFLKINERDSIYTIQTVGEDGSSTDEIVTCKLYDSIKNPYDSLLIKFEVLYRKLSDIEKESLYLSEGPLSVDLIKMANSCKFDKWSDTIDVDKRRKEILTMTKKFYSTYSLNIDKDIFKATLKEYVENVPKSNQPTVVVRAMDRFNGDVEAYCDWTFNTSVFADSVSMANFVNKYNSSRYAKLSIDPIFQLASELNSSYQAVASVRSEIYKEIDVLMKDYMKAQMDMGKSIDSTKLFYPDANFTLRVSYGIIQGYEPKDGAIYKYYTTLNGIIEKGNEGVYDWVVDPALTTAFNNKDYGKYADSEGNIIVCFIASNHTTGGNSGSPVLNSKGELIGLNFDRCWEGTMSDLIYDADICRNIVVDIRYCLFVMDKVGGAKYLVDEILR